MRVQIYKNLHKSNDTGAVYSVRDKASRRVIDHRRFLVLENVKFYVSAKGRERVLRERCKNVHAWVEGDLDEFMRDGEAEDIIDRLMLHESELREVTYNPYKYDNFIIRDCETQILSAEVAIVSPFYIKVDTGSF